MRQILEGSRAIALTIKNIKPAVVSAYPITPQTHIVEDLAKFKADGDADYEYVRAESEFAAASIVAGASATGVRTYTATSSQGLLLMTEVLFNIAGMRLPVVLTCANRAVSGPISIWNDQQDSVTIRDSGWIMLYGGDNQEVADLHVQAFKIAEKEDPLIVLQDIRMPGIDGIETLQRMKQKRPNNRVIMVTCVDDIDRMEKAKMLGADTYITKPLVLDELVKAVTDAVTKLKPNK